jgi:SAM-dependent methyltransferase
LSDNGHLCPLCASALRGPVIADGADRLLALGGSFEVWECARCELGVTTPQPGPEELSRHYPGQYGPYQPTGGLSARIVACLRRARADAVLRSGPFPALLEGRRSGRVLDVGGGRGDMAAALARRGWTAHVVEPSPGAVAAARALGVDAVAGTLAEAPERFAGCDLVIFNHSLEHLPDPRADLADARRRLGEGGQVVVAAPDWSCWQRRRAGSSWFHLDLPRHLFHYSPRALEALARGVGLEPLETRRATSLVGLPGSIQYRAFGRCIARGPWLRAGLAVACLLYPLTLLAGRMTGGDTVYFVARRTGR